MSKHVKELILSKPDLVKVYHTGDGYRFWQQPDGSWGDGDLSWPTEEEMVDSLGDAQNYPEYKVEMEPPPA